MSLFLFPQIREHRLRLRSEGDLHPECGLAEEDRLKMALSTATLAQTKGKNISECILYFHSIYCTFIFDV